MIWSLQGWLLVGGGEGVCDNALRYPQRNLAHDDEEESAVALETVVQMQRHAHV